MESGAARLFPNMEPLALGQLNDESLVERCQATADNDCYAELFRRHGRHIHARCYHMVGNATDAEDLTQRTFARAFAALGQFHPGSFRAWLFAIARHECINYLKSAIVREPSEQMQPLDGNEETTSFEGNLLLTDQVRQLLSQLPSHQRLAVKLFYIGGYSYKEIAAKTGLSENEVKTHLQNGIGRLKRQLAKRRAAEK